MDKNLESSFNKSIIDIIEGHNNVLVNLERKDLIKHVLDNREAMASKNGALATWNAPESTGRRPIKSCRRKWLIILCRNYGR